MNEARRQNRNSHLAVQFLFRCPCAAFCRWHQNRLAKFLSGRDEKAAAERGRSSPNLSGIAVRDSRSAQDRCRRPPALLERWRRIRRPLLKGTSITFQRGLNPIIAIIDAGHSCQTRGQKTKIQRGGGTKGRCCGAVTVGRYRRFGIAPKQPN
jgi:hypothetical protein